MINLMHFYKMRDLENIATNLLELLNVLKHNITINRLYNNATVLTQSLGWIFNLLKTLYLLNFNLSS